MMQIILEIFQRRNIRQNLPYDMFMVFDDIFKSIRFELVSGLQVEKLPERETSQVVALDDAVELGALISLITLLPVNTIFSSG